MADGGKGIPGLVTDAGKAASETVVAPVVGEVQAGMETVKQQVFGRGPTQPETPQAKALRERQEVDRVRALQGALAKRVEKTGAEIAQASEARGKADAQRIKETEQAFQNTIPQFDVRKSEAGQPARPAPLTAAQRQQRKSEIKGSGVG